MQLNDFLDIVQPKKSLETNVKVQLVYMIINVTQTPSFQISFKTASLFSLINCKISEDEDYKCKSQQTILKHILYWLIYVSFHLMSIYQKYFKCSILESTKIIQTLPGLSRNKHKKASHLYKGEKGDFMHEVWFKPSLKIINSFFGR